MFDFANDASSHPIQTVFFLSNPLGNTREWTGLAQTIGALATCRAFDRPDAFRTALSQMTAPAHLVAHGSAAYHALQVAAQDPDAVQSVTLIDPDILAAVPDMHACPTYHKNLSIMQRAKELCDQGQTQEAAQLTVDWWMGRATWHNTNPTLQVRFASAMPALVAEWQMQEADPLCLLNIATVRCPIKLVLGRKTPAGIRSLAQLVRLALPNASLQRVSEARGACHLTHPHVVGPELRNFVVEHAVDWQSAEYLQAA